VTPNVSCVTTGAADAHAASSAPSSTPLLDALTAAAGTEPVTDPSAQRHLLRPVIADLVDQPPSPTLLGEVTTVLAAANTDASLVLSAREWLELAAATERCLAHTHALQLATIAALDRAAQAAKPLAATRRDTRRAAADEIAPAFKVAPGTAANLVGLARRLEELPAAEEALASGAMTLAQVKVLITALRALPAAHHASIEAIAVRKAASMTRARLAAAVDQAALDADPAYAARKAAQGVAERDVRLVPSPVPGCARVVADLERLDAAAVWQVLNAVARTAKDTAKSAAKNAAKDTGEDSAGGVLDGLDLDGLDADASEEERSLAQLRADALVSTVVGVFAPTAVQRRAAQVAAPGTAPGATDEDADLPEDTRGPVAIPTPAQRAHLAEVHVVVLADDLEDDPTDDPVHGPAGDPDSDPDSDPDESRTGPAPESPRARRRPRRDATSRRSGAGIFGWVPGIGRIAPAVMRDVLARAAWRRLVADPATATLLTRSRWRLPPPRRGPVHSLEDRPDDRLQRLRSLAPDPPPSPEVQYRPSSTLAAFVRARDATCIGPACHHAARSGGIQLDHTVAWGPALPGRPRGGTTEAGNLGCVCQPVHTAKTHGGWSLVQPEPGRFVWTSATGRVYHRAVTPLLPELATDAA